MAKPVDPVPEGAPISRFQAQLNLGLFAAHDWVMFGLIAVSLVCIPLFAIWGELTTTKTIICLLCACFFSLAWLIVLVYRCLVFILDLHSDVALMPEAAARIAVGFFEGRSKK
jgi:dolichyl-phosphate-mannose--protein O-mannosyl transferase